MALKIAVLVKEVPDLEVKVGVSDGGTELEVEDRNVLNFFDELAVEEAVRIRESGLAAEVYCVSAGDGRGNEAARRGLAMGADSAFLVDDAVLANADPLTIARSLAALVEREGYDLVLAGKQSTDDESGLVAAMVAELPGIPCVAGVVELELEEGSARVVREQPDGKETLRVPLPAVLTADAESGCIVRERAADIGLPPWSSWPRPAALSLTIHPDSASSFSKTHRTPASSRRRRTSSAAASAGSPSSILTGGRSGGR